MPIMLLEVEDNHRLAWRTSEIALLVSPTTLKVMELTDLTSNGNGNFFIIIVGLENISAMAIYILKI